MLVQHVLLLNKINVFYHSGKGITVNVCTPGLVRGTGHLANSPLMGALCAKVITYPWMWLFMKSADKGAQVSSWLINSINVSELTNLLMQVVIHLSTDPKFQTETGGFYKY